ncbi:hypothetical protein EWM64_g2548 [Hericium alpestre]|uniref:Uncharacterized protein n=1 Tax=Hericium alpestre TaxID=135208 RepID=A0A4Z0A6D5_9AGAM|nr:hypothetical protein EWM64_g2548 [Hericium alpestre]
MNFFDATYEPTGAVTPPRESGHARQQSLNEEVTEVIGQLGKFWGGFRKQSQDALQAARKDLGGYVEQAQKELSKLTVAEEPTEPASGSAAREALPGSEEYQSSASTSMSGSATLAGNDQPEPQASASSQSLFTRLQSSLPPDLLTKVQNSLPETIRSAPERVDLTTLRTTLQNVRVQDATARGEELLRGAQDFLRARVV